MSENFTMLEVLPTGVSARTVYVARDGSEHRSVQSAVDKNGSIDRARRANAMLAAGANVYDAARVWSWMDNPTIPEILRNVNKDTPLIISYWQCQDTPGYKVGCFEEDGYYIYVGGDAGSWSGAYGNKMTISDLARFAEDTLRKHPELAAPKIEARRAETQSGSVEDESLVPAGQAPDPRPASSSSNLTEK